MYNTKTIIISAINLTSGGPLTILKDCLGFLSSNAITKEYKIIALVNNRRLAEYPNIHYIEFPKSKRHWINRLYYEYFYFRKISKIFAPYLWLSLHDMTPSVHAHRLAVYMHNSSMFYSVKLRDFKFDKSYILFALFYKYLYRINIKKNDFCIVQQYWFKKAISKSFGLSEDKIIVAKPIKEQDTHHTTVATNPSFCHTFFFPSLGRPFKNFEIICKAVEILNNEGIENFNVVLTIDGTENKYTKWIISQYGDTKHIKFVGILNKQQMKQQYQETDCLIFPSRLETWGLPISEFAQYKRPMILANLQYAHETAEECSFVSFFDPNQSKELAARMQDAIEGNFKNFRKVPKIQENGLVAPNWKELFNILLK